MAASKKVMTISIAGGILLVALAGVCVYFFLQFRTVNMQLAASKDPKVDLQLTIARVRRHIMLPTNETPTLAIVSNVEALKSQAFFANAKNGDKVLVYTNAKKAYLYDPIADVIVEVGPIVITPPSPTPTSNVTADEQALLHGTTPSPTPTPELLRAAVYNGTKQADLTDSFILSMRGKVTNVLVADKQAAANTNYPITLVIPVTSLKTAEVQAVATAIGATFQKALPAGETMPKNDDFLIIIGSDQIPKGP
jgi:hypothetical protein